MAEKSRAVAKWQRSYNPVDKTIFDKLGHLLKMKLKEVQQEEQFEQHVSKLTRHIDNSIWALIKKSTKPKLTAVPIRKTDNGPWGKSDKENVDLFAEHMEAVFNHLHNER